MKTKFLYGLAGVILIAMLVTGAVLAMNSDNYRLGWFVPSTGSGGSASSTNYAAEFTVGQTAVGNTDNASYDLCLGYWCGAEVGHLVELPMILREVAP